MVKQVLSDIDIVLLIGKITVCICCLHIINLINFVSWQGTFGPGLKRFFLRIIMILLWIIMDVWIVLDDTYHVINPVSNLRTNSTLQLLCNGCRFETVASLKKKTRKRALLRPTGRINVLNFLYFQILNGILERRVAPYYLFVDCLLLYLVIVCFIAFFVHCHWSTPIFFITATAY